MVEVEVEMKVKGPRPDSAGRALQLQHGGFRGADLDDGVAHRALPPQLGPSLCGAGGPKTFKY